MKQFFKFMFASMAGFSLTLIILFFIFAAMMASLMTFSKKTEVTVKPNTVLYLTLKESIPERTLANPFSFGGPNFFSTSNVPGILETIEVIEKAAEDDNIKGIYMEMSEVPSGLATLEEIRNALLKFKESGKFIIAYGEVYSQKAYYMSTVADIITLNPEGGIDFRGMSGELVFYKGLLNKLDINAQIIRHGKYKSAIEPFINDKMSEANREQTLAYFNSLWQHLTAGISETRGIDPARLQVIADSLLVQTPEDALNYHFVDQVIYKDQLNDLLRGKLGIGENDKIELITPGKYKDVAAKTSKKRAKDKVAVIYAVGSINDGEGSDESIGSERISKAIRKARTDSTVKAIVFRVNSPGGSALASDVILREIKLAHEVKPVVVSMGDYAASGGYYISCAADTILAQPTTLTGSIGVFGVIPDFSKFFNNKLGVTFDVAKTNKHADYMSVTKPLDPYAEKVITNSVERIYATFIGHVADGRSMTVAQVDSIGQGRVWSGTDGVKTGLVDKTGGLKDAIAIAARMAGLDDYRITSLPEQKDPFTQIMEELSGKPSETRMKKEFGQLYPYIKEMRSAAEMTGIQARLPFFLNIH